MARSACLLAVWQPGYRHGTDGEAPVIGGNRGHLISNTASKAQMLAVANSSVRHRYAERRHSRELAGDGFEMLFDDGEIGAGLIGLAQC